MLIFCFILYLGTLYIRRRSQLLRENAKQEVNTLIFIYDS